MSDGLIQSVVVVGMGKVGSLVGTLLHEAGFEVTGIDCRPRSGLPFTVETADIQETDALLKSMKGAHAAVSCLPYHLNLPVARAAHSLGLHYFDLTEDVPTTNAILDMSATAKGVMAPQCGLAPGFIGIVGASVAKNFDQLRAINLRVGALPQHPSGLLGYAFNWSPEGVVNEYLNDCEVIKNGKTMMVPAMGDLETIVIQGLQLEAFTTSGGLGTMCDTFSGRVDELNYKTMRYPGHCELMRFFFQELHMHNDRAEAGKILVNAKPPVNDDVVYVHASVEGLRGEELCRDEFVKAYTPMTVAGQTWRAISWTTAASICAVVEMVSNGTLPSQGFLRQEDISLEDFLKTKNGSFYGR